MMVVSIILETRSNNKIGFKHLLLNETTKLLYQRHKDKCDFL